MKLETPRLKIRPINSDDAPFILGLLNDENYIKNIRDSQVRTLADAENYIQNTYLKSYSINGYGLCLLESKSHHAPVGICGIVKRDELPHPDLGFALSAKAQGKVYIAESAMALLEHGKQSLGLKEVWAITVPENLRSIQVLKKLGFGFDKQGSLGSTKTIDFYRKVW